MSRLAMSRRPLDVTLDGFVGGSPPHKRKSSCAFVRQQQD